MARALPVWIGASDPRVTHHRNRVLVRANWLVERDGGLRVDRTARCHRGSEATL